MSKHGFLERPRVIEALLKMLEDENKLLLQGDPGLGKTFLLGKIGKDPNSIYISLLDKSPLQVFSYLTNKLLIKQGLACEQFTNEREAQSTFEATLQASRCILLIDDVDRNASIASSLFSTHFCHNKVVFAARSDSVLRDHSIQSLAVKAFTQKEMELYIQKKNLKLTTGDRIKLFRASQGNPLYLYFFTRFQIDPLPEGLHAYQIALWRHLDSSLQELLGIISLSLFSLSIETIQKTANKLTTKKKSSMEVANSLNQLSGLVSIRNGYYKIFHFYFQEFIVKQVKKIGLKRIYHRALGESYLEKKRIINATFHFLRANDNRADANLIEASQYAYFHGLWDLSLEFLERQLQLSITSSDVWAQGYCHYHLCRIQREKANFRKAKYHVQEAIKSFKSCGDKTWTRISQIWLYLDWVSEGKGKKAINALLDLLNIYKNADQFAEAQVLVNLSYAYILQSQAKNGAKAAKKAYEIFAEHNDYVGLATSLINLTACLGQLEEYKLVEKYAKKIIKISRNFKHLRFEAAGLNQLALAQRKTGNPTRARDSLQKAIDICQHLGSIDSENT